MTVDVDQVTGPAIDRGLEIPLGIPAHELAMKTFATDGIDDAEHQEGCEARDEIRGPGYEEPARNGAA